MPRPFEVSHEYLDAHLNELVDATFADLQSQFLVMPRGTGFVEYGRFQAAYEVLKRHTAAFTEFTEARVWDALREQSLAFVVMRTILGMTPPELAELARTECGADVSQGAARALEGQCRTNPAYLARLSTAARGTTIDRVRAMVTVAISYITAGAPQDVADTVHRLAKVDTVDGIASVRHVAEHHVPYAVLLYERYLGRPFAGHRDAVSELVGEVMESAIEECLARAKITHRKTRRAERIGSFEQAPDFFVPDEFSPAVIIEAKITGDDGTARDKVSRILRLAEMRDRRMREGHPDFEVVACIDGRGFGVRRQDMRDLLKAVRGKVFTLNTLDQLIAHTRLAEFVPRHSST
jgi:hypothetical protein